MLMHTQGLAEGKGQYRVYVEQSDLAETAAKKEF